jgi:hypothetical protein
MVVEVYESEQVLVVLDVADPKQPREVGRHNADGLVFSVAALGNDLCVIARRTENLIRALLGLKFSR